MSGHRTIIWDDGYTKYKLGGGMGSWAESIEGNNLPIGTTRYIKGIVMYLYSAYPIKWSFKNEYNWVPIDKTFKWSDLEEWMNKYE